MSAASQGAIGTTTTTTAAQGAGNSWFSIDSLKNTLGLSSDPNKKVTDAQIALDKAKADLESAQREASAASQGAVQSPVEATMGGGRRRTRRSKK